MIRKHYQKKQSRKYLILFLLLLCLVGLKVSYKSLIHISPPLPGTYKVVEFYDGDTLAVNMNGVIEKIRFIGVDTPETHKPNTPKQCYGLEAGNYTKQRIDKLRVRLEADSQSTNRDKYNRLLRYVYLPDGTLMNKELIINGYGFAMRSFSHSKKDEFVSAENIVRESKIGLWGSCIVNLQGYYHTNNL